MVFQNRSNFFSGIPPFQYLLQITLTYSTSNSSPTHSLQIPLFLSPLHLYIITDNHSRPFCPSHLSRACDSTPFISLNKQSAHLRQSRNHSFCLFIPLFSKTHSSHQLLPQLDSRKPLSVQICICTILSTHRWVCNSVMINQVMETTPC